VFTSICHIAKNTFRESLREPIYLILLATALTLIGIYPMFTLFVFREQVKLVVDSAMATTLVFGWIAAVLCASYAISREINNGTALLVLSKPVKRFAFIVAKILGIIAALLVFWFLTSLATLIALRVAKDQFWLDNTALSLYFGALLLSCGIGALFNFLRQSPFPMATILSMLVVLPVTAIVILVIPVNGKLVPYAWEMLPALALIAFAVFAMGTLATALSTRLDLVGNLIVCSVFFLTGLVSDYLLGQHAAQNWLAAVLYAAIPNWQLFWMADALAAHKIIPWSYVAFGGLYVSFFIMFFVVLAVSLFWNREIGRQAPI
jgi:hypothetical protein